jgi:UDP-glucose 4-epimerase
MNPSPGLPSRVAITGSAGLYGRALVREIRRSRPDTRILGIDIREGRSDPPHEFRPLDIRNPALSSMLAEFRPGAVIHLAYVVEPGRNRAEMRTINVDGTRNLLAATAACGADRLLVASSATVYGAWPDNPPWCDESTPLRPRLDYYYSEHKGVVERLVEEFAADHPEIAVARTRPAIICGPAVRNFLSDIFLSLPIVMLPDGADTPLQFVHEDDLARATLAIVERAARGPFNVAPDGVLTQRQIAAAMGVVAVPMPFFVIRAVTSAWWALRLPWFRTPPGFVHYMRYPWVMRSDRLRQELNFAFEHSCRESFRTLLPRATGGRPAMRRIGTA